MILLDEKTGEVLKEYSTNELLMVYDAKKIDFNILKKTNFYRLSRNSINFFIDKNVKGNIKITFFKLVKMLELNKGEILLHNGRNANMKTISSVLEINIKTLYNHVKQLEKYEIVKRIKNGRDVNIALNPYFIWYGNKVTEEFNIFRKTMWVVQPIRMDYKNMYRNDAEN